jgi:hypothetical protein
LGSVRAGGGVVSEIDALRAEIERLRDEHRIMGETLTAAQEIATRETLRRRELEAEVNVLRALQVTP